MASSSSVVPAADVCTTLSVDILGDIVRSGGTK